MREKKKALDKIGMEGEDKQTGKALTAERIEQLNSIGFVWSLQPKTSWEDRLRDVVEYYEEHGRWPTKDRGQPTDVLQLGGWVDRQRNLYRKKDESFMRDKFPRVSVKRMISFAGEEFNNERKEFKAKCQRNSHILRINFAFTIFEVG